jgi:hypothetical protein
MKRLLLKYKMILAASVVMFGLSWNVETAFGQGEKWNYTRENKFKDPFAHSSANDDEDQGSLRDGSITPGDPGNTGQGEDFPIGNAIPFLMGLALIYGISLSKNKTKLIITHK